MKSHKHYYAKGVLVGMSVENFFLIFFLIMISSKDGYEFFGLWILWFLVIIFNLIGIFYFIQNKDASGSKDE